MKQKLKTKAKLWYTCKVAEEFYYLEKRLCCSCEMKKEAEEFITGRQTFFACWQHIIHHFSKHGFHLNNSAKIAAVTTNTRLRYSLKEAMTRWNPRAVVKISSFSATENAPVEPCARVGSQSHVRVVRRVTPGSGRRSSVSCTRATCKYVDIRM